VQGIALLRAAIVAPLAEQALNERQRRGEGGLRGGAFRDPPTDVAGQPAEPGAHPPEHALGLAVAAAVAQPRRAAPRRAAPGVARQPRGGLAQRDRVPPGEADEDLDATAQQLAVGGVGDRLGLDGGGDGDALEVLLLDGPGAPRGGQGLGEQQCEPLGPDAPAPAGPGGAVERQRVLEVGFAAGQLDIRAVEVAGADGVIRQPIHVLEQVQADHQAGRQAGAADAVAVERAERFREARPADQPRQAGAPAGASGRPDWRGSSGTAPPAPAAAISAASARSRTTARRGNHAAGTGSTAAAICKLSAARAAVPCDSRYFRSRKNRQISAPQTILHGRLHRGDTL
jgi:hypothetical protein